MASSPFNLDAFSNGSLVKSIVYSDFIPTQIGDTGLFKAESVNTSTVSLETDGTVVSLVGIKPRGAPAQVIGSQNKRKLKTFTVPHLPQIATVLAGEVANVREFGTEKGMRTVQSIIAKKSALARANIDYTTEAHRLDAIMGNYNDVNGTKSSLYTEMGTAQQVETIDLSAANTDLLSVLFDIRLKQKAALGGIPSVGGRIYYGDAKWAELLKSKSVAAAYANWQNSVLPRDPRAPLVFGGFEHVWYSGSSLVEIPKAEAYAVPLGVIGQFIQVYAPAETMTDIGGMGMPYYATTELMDHDAGIEIKYETNVLTLNMLPASVIKLN